MSDGPQGRIGQGPRGGPHRPPVPRGARVDQAPPGPRSARPDSIRKRLSPSRSPRPRPSRLNRLHLVQEKQRLEAELAHSGDVGRPGRLEKSFVRLPASYATQGHLVFGMANRRGQRLGPPAGQDPLHPGLIQVGRPPGERGPVAASLAAGRCGPPTRSRQRDRRSTTPSARAQERVRRPLGMGHEPDDVAPGVAHPGDVVDRAVRVVRVAQHDAVLAAQLGERRGVAGVVALEVVDRDAQFGARPRPRRRQHRVRCTRPGPRRWCTGTAVPGSSGAHRAAARPRSAPGTRCRSPPPARRRPRTRHDGLHDRREPGDRPRAAGSRRGRSRRAR